MRKIGYCIVLTVTIIFQGFSQKNVTDTSYQRLYNVYENILVPKQLKSKQVTETYRIGGNKFKCQTIKIKRKDVACPPVSNNNHEGLGVFEWIAVTADALKKTIPCVEYTELFKITRLHVDTLLTFSNLVSDAANYQKLTLAEHFFIYQTAFPIDIYIKRAEYDITFYYSLNPKEWLIIKSRIRDPQRESLRILADLLSGNKGDILFELNNHEYLELIPVHSSYYKIF